MDIIGKVERLQLIVCYCIRDNWLVTRVIVVLLVFVCREMTKEDKTSNDEGNVEMSSSVSDVGTCQSLPSQIFTCVSLADDNNSITASLTSLTQEDSQKVKHVKQKDEIRITGGTEKSSISRTKRRVHNEEIIYGERIADDLINEYCDKLNTALRHRFDGMLAIQYIAVRADHRCLNHSLHH